MINSIDKWKNFKVNNIFNTNEKGKITNSNNLDNGNNYYYIGAKKNENGYMKGIKSKYNNLLTKGNCIGWVRQGVGSSGYSTYQPKDFYLASTVQILRNNILNKYHYLFFIPILDLEFPKYNFGRALSKKNIDNTIIKLPIKRDLNNDPIIDNSKKYSEEGYIPDFEYMENYIKKILNKFPKIEEIKEPKIENNLLNFNVKLWKNFNLIDLFYLNRSKPVHKNNIELNNNGEYYYISRTSQNNGVIGKTNNYEKLYKNVITIGGEGIYSFYHNYEFTTGNNITILKLKFKINQYIGLFLKTILDLENFRYSYNRARNINLIKKESIKLPIKRDLNNDPIIDNSKKYSEEGYIPDFEYMENYIKNLKYTKYL